MYILCSPEGHSGRGTGCRLRTARSYTGGTGNSAKYSDSLTLAAPLAKVAGMSSAPSPDIAANLAAVRRRIAEAAGAAGRRAADVTLVAVGKTHDSAAIARAIAAGQRVFGENRVQEAQAKYPALKAAHPDLALHLIGPLQTNKVKDAVALFDVIETLDRKRLAEALARELERHERRPALFVQVNTGEEPQKAGVLPGEADAFIEDCRARLGLAIAGLMCIPPVDEEPSLHFALLREIARRQRIGALSMGMSGDYDIAIRFGATHVRVGTAIFGPRPAAAPDVTGA
jgi:pyridoxal phosphate enzyme (YggS family)